MKKRLNALLVGSGTVLAAAAGLSVLDDVSQALSAALAFAAAAITGLNAAFNPARDARKKFLLANKWARWMDDVEALLRRRKGELSEDGAESQFGKLLDRRDALRNEELDDGERNAT
ncbi:MAG: hypothetical protein M3515_01435 [Actinomycetota bacterium]|nr:hypothetical protein [Actinomycetota bacterium]